MIAERPLSKLRPRQLLRLARRSLAPRVNGGDGHEEGGGSAHSEAADANRQAAGTSGRRRVSRRVRSATPGRRHRLTPHGRRALAAVGVLFVVLAGAWLWLRDSSLASVDEVTVTGVQGADAAAIRSALTAAAHRMTTLDVDTGELRSAMRLYPVVADVRVSADFPHRLRIDVVERRPLGTVSIGGRLTAVSADGTVLNDLGSGTTLPEITTPAPVPAGARVTEPAVRRALALLAAASPGIIPRLSQAGSDPTHGLSAQLRNGPRLYFGDGSRLAAKWMAVTAVLGDPGSSGAAYIDVTDPERHAAGAGSAQTQSGAASSGATAQTQSGAASSGATAQTQSGAASTGAGSAQTQTGSTTSTSGTAATAPPTSPSP